MLDAYVIDEIKRRERDRSRDEDRPVVELPVPSPAPATPDTADDDRKGDRGVVIIDYSS